MNYWLIKSEPYKYSWDNLVKDKKTYWDGVRNFKARKNMKTMQKGDLLLFYHSNEGKEVVGIAKVVKEHYPDPTASEGAWVVMDIAPVKALKTRGYFGGDQGRRTFQGYGAGSQSAPVGAAGHQEGI